MVRGVSKCYVCDEQADDDHWQMPLHALRLHQAFVDPERFDHLVRECRPSERERSLKALCLERAKLALRPATLHVTGSVGKETALRGEHDLDVVLVVPGGPTDAFLEKAEVALETYGFCNVHVQRRKDIRRRLITAQYEDLSLDIVPVQHLGDSGWAREAVNSAKFFGQLSAWRKDVVRVLKALLRLRFPNMPGILLEACVLKVEATRPHILRGTWAVLQSLAQLAPCRCPCTGRDLMQDDRVRNTHGTLQGYCLDLLALRHTPRVDLGTFCRQSLPCQHQLTVAARRSFTGRILLNHNVASLMLSLNVHFQSFEDRDHVREASQHDESYIKDFLAQRFALQALAREREPDSFPHQREGEHALVQRQGEDPLVLFVMIVLFLCWLFVANR